MANSTPDPNDNPAADAQAGALGWQPTPGLTSEKLTILRREEIVIGPHSGPLDVRGDWSESALLVDKKLMAFHWHCCDGGEGQDIVRSMSRACAAVADAFRPAVDTPIGETETLASHFSDVLSLLAAGVYVLNLEEMDAQSYVVELNDKAVDGVDLTGFYDGFGAMVATQSVSQLSATHIEQLCERIRQGARPTIITLSVEWDRAEFILDGHHKLSAYRRAAVPAVRLNIVRRNSALLPLAEALAFIPPREDYHANLTQNRQINEEQGRLWPAPAAEERAVPPQRLV